MSSARRPTFSDGVELCLEDSPPSLFSVRRCPDTTDFPCFIAGFGRHLWSSCGACSAHPGVSFREAGFANDAGHLHVQRTRPMAEGPSGRSAVASRSDRRQIRVCHLAYTFYETDNRVMRYAESSAGSGDDDVVIALRREGQAARDQVGGVFLHRIQRRTVTETNASQYLVKLLWFLVKAGSVLTFLQLRSRFDVVHVHNVPDFLVLAAIVPKLTGA